jgi:hypothetical protein
MTDTYTDEEFNIDEAVPANRGLWVSVVYPGTFDLPESRFQEETGPFNFTRHDDHYWRGIILRKTYKHISQYR